MERSEQIYQYCLKDGELAKELNALRLATALCVNVENNVRTLTHITYNLSELIGKAETLTAAQQRNTLELVGHLFVGLSSQVPTIQQARVAFHAHGDSDASLGAIALLKAVSLSLSALNYYMEILDGKGIWKNKDGPGVPLSRDVAESLAQSMGVDTPEILKAMMDEAREIKDADDLTPSERIRKTRQVAEVSMQMPGKTPPEEWN